MLLGGGRQEDTEKVAQGRRGVPSRTPESRKVVVWTGRSEVEAL